MSITATPNKTPRIHTVRNLSPADERLIRDHLRKAVETWSKASKGTPFGVRELMGKDWNGTPLQVLYERHLAKHGHRGAHGRAAAEAGWLLKRVLEDDIRKYEAVHGYRRAVYREVT